MIWVVVGDGDFDADLMEGVPGVKLYNENYKWGFRVRVSGFRV